MGKKYRTGNAPVDEWADALVSAFSGETFSQTVARIRLRRNVAGQTLGSDPRWAHGRVDVAAERAKCRSGDFAAKFRWHSAKVSWRR